MKSSLYKIAWTLAIIAATWVACAATLPSRVVTTAEVEEAQCPPGTSGGYCPNPTPQGVEPLPVVRAKAPRSAVRIRIWRGKQGAIGSGTIIRGSAKQAIILTCAHVFAGDGGRYPSKLPFDNTVVMIDVFDPKVESFTGKCIGFNQDSDVGLIAFDPGRRLQASTILPSGSELAVGSKLFSVGCSGGAYPTVLPSRLIGAMKFAESPRSVHLCNDAPVQGRSGGGLHLASDGRLVGTCTGYTTGGTKQGLYPQSESAWDLIRYCKLEAAINEPEPETETIEAPKKEASPKPKPEAKPIPETKPIPEPETEEAKLGKHKQPRQSFEPKPEVSIAVNPVPTNPANPGFKPDPLHWLLGSSLLASVIALAAKPLAQAVADRISASSKPTDAKVDRPPADQPTAAQIKRMTTATSPIIPGLNEFWPPNANPNAPFDDRLHRDHTGELRSVVAGFVKYAENADRLAKEKADAEAADKRLDQVAAKLFDAVRPTVPSAAS